MPYILCKKSIVIDFRLSDKSLNQIKKNNGPRIDLSDLPTSTGNQSNVWGLNQNL